MMDLPLLDRIRKTSIILGAALAIVFTYYWGAAVGVGWAAGIVWSLVNLHFTGSLMKKVVTTEERKTSEIVVAVLIKFPVLYGIGLLLLWNGRLSVAGLVAGFTWPLFVAAMKGLGRYYLKLDDTSRASRDGAALRSEGKPSRV